MHALAFVDLETTGANASLDRITEIGIIEVDDAGVREWSTLVNPETEIPTFIQVMTGITPRMVKDAPVFADVAREALERLNGRLFIAHNARFDYGFLKNEFLRIGIEFRPKVLCTVKLSRRLFPQHKRHGLDALIERHGLTPSGRHRALSDAQLIHQFWQQIHQNLPATQVEQVLKELTGRPSLPSNVDPGMIDALPEGPGVYLFYGENELPLYIGKAKDIRKRVLSHFATDHSSPKEMSLAQQVRRIDFIATGGEIGALLKESALIKQMQPSHNRQLRRNSELCTLTLTDHGAGLVVPVITYARDLDFGDKHGIYGLFKSAKQATALLLELADEFGLCHSVLGLEKVRPGSPCFAHQVKKCRGACVAAEPLAAHTVRLMQGLGQLRLQSWPFSGPAALREGDEMLIIDRWAYLGTARADEDIWPLLEQQRPQFDRDSYRILTKVAHRLRPLRPVSRG